MDRWKVSGRIGHVRCWLALLVVTVLPSSLSACGSQEAGAPPAHPAASEASPSAEGDPACVPHRDGHARICGLAPPQRKVPEGTAYKVAAISGDSFWVVLPDELAPASGVVAVPGLPIPVRAHLTTASDRDAADRYCDGFPACEPAVVDRKGVRAGVLTRWDDASGTIRDLGVTTVAFGSWTLVITDLDAGAAERVARGLTWSVGEDGYPRLSSTDPEVPVDTDWAEVVLWVPNLQTAGKRHHRIRVVSGCELPAEEEGLDSFDVGPDLQLVVIGYEWGPRREPAPVVGGRWCADGHHGVEVTSAERAWLELFHAKLRIVRSVG